jgi:hypothetical protein
MAALGDAGLFWSFGALGLFLVAFFGWRRSVRPAPVPVAPFHATTPMSAAGAELVVTEELLQGAAEHEHMEDLSGAVPEVDVAEPLVGPPPADESHVAYFDEAEAGPESEPTQEELPGLEPLPSRS